VLVRHRSTADDTLASEAATAAAMLSQPDRGGGGLQQQSRRLRPDQLHRISYVQNNVAVDDDDSNSPVGPAGPTPGPTGPTPGPAGPAPGPARPTPGLTGPGPLASTPKRQNTELRLDCEAGMMAKACPDAAAAADDDDDDAVASHNAAAVNRGFESSTSPGYNSLAAPASCVV